MAWVDDIFGEVFGVLHFDETRLSTASCVYLMAQQTDEDWIIHYVGQTQLLGRRFGGHHQLEAAIARGATHALVMIAPDERFGRDFETLLRWYFRPPLNLEDIPTHMQAWRAAMHCGKLDVAELARTAHMSGTRPMLPSWSNAPRVGRR